MKLDKTYLIVGAILIFLVWCLLNYITYGSLSAVLSKIQGLIVWIIILSAVAAVIYYLFFHRYRVDANFECYKRLCEECKLNGAHELGDLITTGDETHKSKIYGKIIGYSQRQNSKHEEGKYAVEHIFSVRLYGHSLLDKLINMFTKPLLFRIPFELVDELTGDVYIKCNSFNKHLEYFYPNNVHRDFQFTNKNLYDEANRFTQENFTSYLPMLVEKAAGIEQEDEERIRDKSGMEKYRESKPQVASNQDYSQVNRNAN